MIHYLKIGYFSKLESFNQTWEKWTGVIQHFYFLQILFMRTAFWGDREPQGITKHAMLGTFLQDLMNGSLVIEESHQVGNYHIHDFNIPCLCGYADG